MTVAGASAGTVIVGEAVTGRVGESAAVAMIVAVGESGLVVVRGDAVGVAVAVVGLDEAACAAPTPRAGGRDERNKRAHKARWMGRTRSVRLTRMCPFSSPTLRRGRRSSSQGIAGRDGRRHAGRTVILNWSDAC